MITGISWRNLWRNKLRSLVIIAAVAIGILGAVLSDGFMEGMMDQRINAAIDNEISNIQLHNPDFLLNNDIIYTISQPEQYLEAIRELPQVKGVSQRIICAAMASTAAASAGVTIAGVDPEEEEKVSQISKAITLGAYLNNQQRIPVVIGKKLSDKLGLKINDKLIVTLADSSGTITYGAFLVSGIYQTSNNLFDETHVFVRAKDLGPMLGLTNQVHEMAIALHDNQATQEVFQTLSDQFSSQIKNQKIDIKTWDMAEPLLKSMIEMMTFFSYMFLVIILIALSFAIINTMTMAILERKREIGMLMAIGMTKGRVFLMIMLETFFLSVTGGIVGLLLSYLIVSFYARHGLDLGAMGSGMSYIGYASTVYFRVNESFYVASVLLIGITSLLSSIPASIKALKLNPVEAIREIN